MSTSILVRLHRGPDAGGGLAGEIVIVDTGETAVFHGTGHLLERLGKAAMEAMDD